MSDIVLSARGLAKRYTLYKRGSHTLLDFLGLSTGSMASQREEYWALRDVSFDISRGSTVGIIGRNGAGKSTLLRLLAGTSTPTQGELKRYGQVAALLELGTGFHPDLTGHENIYASGLYLGYDRKAMTALYDEIVAFAELGEFLHQPVRTYSTGMYMRLAFSVATCVPAEVQIIDEVLGVGDAYFFRKCLQRFQQLQRQRRTSILVSHDHATLLRLCSRCIWIHEGRVAADGSPLEVITAYLNSIQEEQDRKIRCLSETVGSDISPALALRETKTVHIEQVQFLNEKDMPIHMVSMGETMTLRVTYHARTMLPKAVVSVSIFRLDGVMVCNAISSMDGVQLDLEEGVGAIDLVFESLLFAPGDYTVAVGIYPSLDLSDSANAQHAVIWHQPRIFSIRRPLGVAQDLGIVRHPTRWKAVNRSSLPGREVVR